MELTKWNNAINAIVEAKSIDEVKVIKDKAEAMRAYAKQVGESLTVQNDICDIKLRAERRMGEMLKEMPVKRGKSKMNNHSGESFKTDVVKDLDIKHYERFEKIASLPQETFEKLIIETKQDKKELTEALMLKESKKIDRLIKIEEQKKAIEEGNIKQPEGKYDVIVIDPPWKYHEDGVYDPDGFRGVVDYPTMSLEEIEDIELPYKNDCVLWLWTTHKFMRHSFKLLDAWGFEEKAILTWVKNKMGIGRWLRSKSEFCIMAIKGKPLINLTNQTTVLNANNDGHSIKPLEFYDMVDKLCIGRKLDYFARKMRRGWDTFGDEVKDGQL